MRVSEINHDASWLTLGFPDGSQATYLASWLRDNVDQGRHQQDGQRTFDINLMSPIVMRDARMEGEEVLVTFNDDECHTFDPDRIAGLATKEAVLHHSTDRQPALWGAELQNRLPQFDYAQVRADDSALESFLRCVDRYGFAIVNGVPCASEAVLEVVDLFGYVRVTNYGALFDVRVEPNPANLAFTSQTIGMHTDNPYRDPVPGLQLLHCLINNSDGGENQLVDGFAVAAQLRENHPSAFKTLIETPVEFRFLEAGAADLRHQTPLISEREGQVIEVRYNARSIQAFALDSSAMTGFYDAYRLFGQALHAPEAKVEFRLNPGQLVIFDNQRVLHGRSAYHQGARHLQGCYADKDSLRSKLRSLAAA